jgi:hypothetical protein
MSGCAAITHRRLRQRAAPCKRWQADRRSATTPDIGASRRDERQEPQVMLQIGTVWDRTTAFASSMTSAILPIALLLVFLPVSVQTALEPLLLKMSIGPRLGAMTIFWAMELLGTLAIIVLALGATNRAGEAVRAASPRLLPAIGIFVLLGIVAGVLALPMIIGMKGAGIGLTAMQAGFTPSLITPGLALFVALYGIAYIIVIIWATARLLVIEPVVLAERRGIGAIMRSVRLTRGMTWKLVGVLLLYGIVASIAALAAETVFGSILRLIAPDDGDIGIASVITAIIVAAVSTAFKVLAAIFVGKLYLAAEDTAEGLSAA